MNIKAIILLLSISFSSAFANVGEVDLDPKKLYKNNCRICHGGKGKLGIGGATDLSKSILTEKEAIEVITEGRGAMTPFSGILSKKEIKAIGKYIQTLKQ